MSAFSDLDLSDVSTNRTLGTGVHAVSIQDAKWGPPSPGQPPVLTLELAGADGNLRDVMRPKASNEMGARISKQRIKSCRADPITTGTRLCIGHASYAGVTTY